jgi:hypothetical protein
MYDNAKSHIAATAFAAAFGAAMPLYAAAADALPPEHTHGAIVYRSGGIGAGESAAMQAAAGRYPLEVLFAEREASGAASYSAGDRLSIRDAGGKELLSTVSNGPFLLAHLPAGRYTLTAWHNGKAQTRAVTIGGQHVRVVFEWRASHEQ